MEYDDFDQVDLPNPIVTEPNPSHTLAFRRFSSDQVATFNRLQTDIIRRHSAAPIAHNYMGRITDFDHFKLGADLDIATWDMLSAGVPRRPGWSRRRAATHLCTSRGPGFSGVSPRSLSPGEQRPLVGDGATTQPGELGAIQPCPASGYGSALVLEAFTHGAKAVCYFR